MSRPPVSPLLRFSSKFSIQKNGCWKWLGFISRKGYGLFRFDPGENEIGAHRASWLLHRGPIPSGKLVLHSCDNPECVNPNHLRIGTHADNMKDKVQRNRCAIGSKHGSITKPERVPKGIDHPAAKLAERDIKDIRASHERGVDLASKYKVTPSIISRIRRRVIWTHI